MTIKVHHLGILVLAGIFVSGCSQLQDQFEKLPNMKSSVQERPLDATDVNPQLGHLKDTPFFEKVKTDEELTYLVTNKPNYNSFFKDVAIVNGGFAVANAMVEDANKRLKDYAHSFISAGAIEENIQKTNSDPTLDDITKSLALVAFRKQKGELTKDELEYFTKTAGDLGIAGEGLKESKDTTPKLISQAQELIASAKSDFSSSPGDVTKVMEGLDSSMDKLNKVKDEAQPLLKNLTVLAQGFHSFIEEM